MSIHSARNLTAAIISALESAGLSVGDATKPAGAGWQGAPGSGNFNPYTVVYPTPGGYYDGTISEPYADARVDHTISSFGSSREQAQWGADRFSKECIYPVARN